ncbi:MAG: hypothetical protein Q8M94_08545, partial [Ignavibacteria bacterium]|nr:hypothetical protein [Ignavibacteria bacterium]
MKQFLLFVLFYFLCNRLALAQIPTFADPPGPEHVLVVYNTRSDTSFQVMNYYKDARQIPNSNIVELSLPSDTIITYQGAPHSIKLDQQGEIIRDMNNKDTITPTLHAWIYFNEKIAKKIANHLTTTYINGIPLKDIIRFIVLCKGVPFRIDARIEDADSRETNVICANLLTRIGETMANDNALLDYYNQTVQIPNPYYQADKNFLMEHNFLPNHYQTTVNINGQSRNISLSYLVTHLSAPRFSDVQGMIDRSKNAIYTRNYKWFIDGDPTPCRGWSPVGSTASTLNILGITNYFFDNTTQNVFTSYPDSVMSYSSNGIWTSITDSCDNIPPFYGNYIQTLDFDYADGAFFSSIESHNGLSIGTYPVIRTRGQGLIADFTLKGGTVGVGQAFHSPYSHVIANQDFIPRYAMGYTF